MDGKSSDMAQRHGKYLFGEWRTAWGVPPVGNGKGREFVASNGQPYRIVLRFDLLFGLATTLPRRRC